MVRSGIAQYTEMMKEGTEGFFVKLIGAGYGLPYVRRDKLTDKV